ncbi:1-phosphofructokinase [uncultured Eubacterium sp.]|uniref:1-phosphofructokinase n=1 Tax=uncultured Eubacterium sp. TaxID=165185 RepID=UPI0025E1AD10|nr:1-phosphofructokinase [uncultured Eubacterium sp.]
MVYTITLNPALDYVMKVGKLRYDDINRSASEEIYYGGKGINVSVILTRLGVHNKALGFVAGFTGRKLEQMLVEEGIDCDFNRLKEGQTRINVKIKADTELDVNAQGPDISEQEIGELMEKLDDIKEGDYLVLAGSIPSTLPDDIYERILARLQKRNVNFVVDATGDLLKNVLPYKPFLVKPNHHELGDLFGVETKTEEDIVKYAKKVQEMGARNVLVSRAKDGATLIDENGNVTTFGNVDGKVVNSVGCGDSMVAGFVAGYINKKDYAYALKLGAACGNATAFSEELATADEIKHIFDIM